MRKNNCYSQNQYTQIPCTNFSCCYGCPATYNNYGYYPPIYNDYYRTANEEDFLYDDSQDFSTNARALNVTQEQIENVASQVKKDPNKPLKDIQKFIKDTRLLDYMLLALITYIVNNYHKYQHFIDENTDDLVDDLKKNVPWAFDILKVFGVTPAMVDDFIDNLIRSTVLNLKKLTPAGL